MRIEHSTVQAAPAERFTGEVWVDEIVSGDPSTGQRAMSVRFAPGARTAWHSHPRGQVLRVTEGIGRVQRKGGAVTEIRAGDTVYVEPGEVHWHGAAPHSFMTHLVLQEAGPEDPLIEWLDQVTDAEYQGSSIVREHMVTGDLTGAGDRIDRVELYQITMPPGQAAGVHTHPGGVVGHVIRGRIIFELEGRPAQELSAGSGFFEPPGAIVHRFDNASTTEPATFVACYTLTGDQPLIQPL
ncbi:cupin [Actinomadura rubrobrunea]|uniref:Cupin n=1 Tax=Actinomadura rubrobrunea TaxID=115335 RepID=A0A9W6PWY5_9ACTN|nr:cupin domain-containing protein [Actinomadura rubrobrunea]GLW64554.1 cupin [Actinomadura rubrobrunea]